MKNLVGIFFIIIAIMSLSGCASQAEYYPINPNAPTGLPVAADDVELFITQKPAYKYSEMGMITYPITGSYPVNEISVYNIMRAKAAEIGASGLIIMNSQPSFRSYPTFYTDGYGNLVENNNIYTDTMYRAMAIKKL